jgi:3-phosphoshikimate 1-carboxyvinyltransferase
MIGAAWPEPEAMEATQSVLEIEPGGPLVGKLRVPGDKSVSHRALLLAARAEGTSVLRGLSDGDDVRRTALAMRAVGALVERSGSEAHVSGGSAQLHEPEGPIDVGNSGTAIRLLAGWLAAYPWFSVLYGDSSIATRPMGRVTEPLRRMGATVDGRQQGQFPPLAVRGGRLSGIDLRMAVASAQVKGAVLLAGLGATSPTTVREPAPTRAHTEEMVAACGGDVTVSDDGATVQVRPSALRSFTLDVPGDPSQAAFWVVAACVLPGSDLTLEGIYVGRARAGFLDVLRRMGANLEVSLRDGNTADIRVRAASLRGTTIGGPEVAGMIDELPALAVAAAFATGPSEIRDAGELAVKESNRIVTISSELAAMGARVEARADGLTLSGGGELRGAVLHSHGDHRIAMAMAVAALGAEGGSRVEGWESVASSYPTFATDLDGLRR